MMILVDSVFGIFDLSQALSTWESLVVEATLNKLELRDFDVVNESIFGSHIVNSLSFLV